MHRLPLISAHTSHQRHKSTLGHWARLAPLLNPSYFKRGTRREGPCSPLALSRKSCQVYLQSVKKSCRTRVQLRTTSKNGAARPLTKIKHRASTYINITVRRPFFHRRLVWREIFLDDCGCEIDYLCPPTRKGAIGGEKKKLPNQLLNTERGVFAGVGVCAPVLAARCVCVCDLIISTGSHPDRQPAGELD